MKTETLPMHALHSVIKLYSTVEYLTCGRSTFELFLLIFKRILRSFEYVLVQNTYSLTYEMLITENNINLLL